MKTVRTSRLAPARYRVFSWGLAVISPIKPLFRLALRLLTGRKHRVRGHVLPLNVHLGRPEQVPLGRDLLTGLIGRSTAVAVMNECLCRSVGGCRNYPADLGCLVLGDAVRGLHPSLGRIVSPEEAILHVDRAIALGLSPLVIHFKSDALLWSLEHQRMLTVCFCCPCHCLLRDALGREPGHITGLPGLAVQLDAARCVGCGRCVQACVAGALTMQNGLPKADGEACLACGRCAMACPQGALAVAGDAAPGVEPVVDEYRRRTENGSVFDA